MSAKRTHNGKYHGPEPESYVEVTSADGRAERFPMLTSAAAKKLHEAGKCGAWCGHCYHEATEGLQ